MRAAWVIIVIVSAFAAEAEQAPLPAQGLWASSERTDQLKDQIEAAGPTHPWAGVYQGLGSLIIAPSGEYTFVEWNCTGPSEWDDGVIERKDSMLRFGGAQSTILGGKDFHIVPWGERVYLIPQDRLLEFANSINQGREPHYGAYGFFFMRERNKVQIASGRPGVPKEIAPYVLDHVINATITSVGATTVSTETWPTGEWTTAVVLDVGSREGVLPGMELPLRGEHDGDATIRSVNERSSVADLKSTSTTTPKVGWQASTRRRERAPWDEPYRVLVATSTSGIYPPVSEEPYSLDETYSFSDFPEGVFSVVEVARIEFGAVDRHLLEYQHLTVEIAKALLPLGANAYRTIRFSVEKRRPGPWSYAEEVVAYRIEYEGRPIRRSEFESDGPKTRANILLASNEYHKKKQRAQKELTCGLLRLSDTQCTGWARLKVSELNPEQRKAFETLWDLKETRGRVLDHYPPSTAKWWRVFEQALEARMLKVRAADPVAYSKYVTLLHPDKR